MAQQITEQDLAEVRKIVIFGVEFNMYGTVADPLFLALDIADMIEYSVDNVGQMLSLVDDDEKLTDTIFHGGQSREVWFLTENGLYELLMQSRKPLAKQCKIEIKAALRMLRKGELKKAGSAIIADNLVIIENTRFIWDTNFAGDPKKDKYGSDERKGNLVIPTIDQAMDLRTRGFNIKETKPREGDDPAEFVPTFYVVIKLNYDSQWPPKVYLVNEAKRGVLLEEDTVYSVDNLWVDSVNAVLNVYHGPNGLSLYIKSMEVFQKVDDDPIASRYRDQ